MDLKSGFKRDIFVPCWGRKFGKNKTRVLQDLKL